MGSFKRILQFSVMLSYLIGTVDGASISPSSLFTFEMDENVPLWQRLMTLPNMLGMAAYFSLLLMGFWAIKVLADDDGSKLLNFCACYNHNIHHRPYLPTIS